MIRYLQRISDDRYRRALKRRRIEEVMGWVCVPLILMLVWFAWKGWDQVIADRQPQLRDVFTPASIGEPPLRR